jgi:hypothetical protein
MDGLLIAAAALLLVIAVAVLLLSDLNEIRSRRAMDRIHREGSHRRIP